MMSSFNVLALALRIPHLLKLAKLLNFSGVSDFSCPSCFRAAFRFSFNTWEIVQLVSIVGSLMFIAFSAYTIRLDCLRLSDLSSSLRQPKSACPSHSSWDAGGA